MLDFFVEGGVIMWVILVLGLVFLFSSVRFALRPDRAHYGFLAAMGAATFAASLEGVFVDLAQVMSAVGGPRFAGNPDLNLILMQGIKECTRPGTFGGGVLVLGTIAIAIGAARLARNGSGVGSGAGNGAAGAA